jgi:uncharacterized membrane protein YvbJ
MKYCIRCAKEIGEGHDYCPYCGTPQKEPLKKESFSSSNNQSSKTVIVTGTLVLVVFAVIIAALLEKPSSNHPANSKESFNNLNKDISVLQKASIQVSASQILSEFKNNEIRAGEKYNGKRVSIIGCAADIDNTFGILTVSINSCGGLLDLDFVSAEFPNQQKNKLASLNKGQRIAVDCTIVDGGNIMGVHGTNCTIH